MINYSYFKWDAKSKNILYTLLYLNKKAKINNPIWMVVDTLDLQAQKMKSLKTTLGSSIYE